MSASIPDALLPLLTEANYGMLGTVHPDGSPQVNPMWFELIDGQIRFTHTTARKKFRNLKANPAMSLAVLNPKNPYSYIELRGSLKEVIPDPEGAFYVKLQQRYGNPSNEPPADKADRVILVMSIDHIGGR